MRRLSESAGNPAHALRAEYNGLMQLQDVNALRERALGLVVNQPGISPTNAKRFERTVRSAPTAERLQAYLTNFLLKADGLGVI